MVGEQLRKTAQLIDVETELQIWDEKMIMNANDIFTLIDEEAQNIANSLRSELSIEELEDIRIGYQVNPEAYEYYLKGVHFH